VKIRFFPLMFRPVLLSAMLGAAIKGKQELRNVDWNAVINDLRRVTYICERDAVKRRVKADAADKQLIATDAELQEFKNVLTKIEDIVPLTMQATRLLDTFAQRQYARAWTGKDRKRKREEDPEAPPKEEQKGQ
jgi:hypothetical protein